ncbi:helix-turn-helix domain-containing protein [Alteribacillus sp. HJP-4]|uniref:helix-turn-helix domain-containing protein n=1 Tax=Alteribacillus sp. HJP-4 TaxID=2775394 RepID=UPI0035CD3118
MIGDRIVRYRMEKDISAAELAKKAGIPETYMRDVEQNIYKFPSVQYIEKISSVLNIPLHYLIEPSQGEDDGADLDEEWREVVEEAMDSGISKDRFKEFLKSKNKNTKHTLY